MSKDKKQRIAENSAIITSITTDLLFWIQIVTVAIKGISWWNLLWGCLFMISIFVFSFSLYREKKEKAWEIVFFATAILAISCMVVLAIRTVIIRGMRV